MFESLMQQKQLVKQELQRECRKIEAVLKELMPHHHFNDPSMKSDEELIVRCDHAHVMAIGVKEMADFGITQATLANFHILIMRFSMLLEGIKKKINELYGETGM